VRTAEWKWIRYPHGDGSPDRFAPELYHLTDDPLEQHNLADDPRFARQRRRLERELERLSRRAGPDRIPVYEGIVNVLPKY
jgi:arylsulfatase A-like enzyme